MQKLLFALAAAAAAFSAYINSNGGDGEDTTSDAAGEQDKPKRGRPKGSTNAAPAEVEKPKGMSLDQLRELTADLIKGGEGDKVKATIKKFTGTDGGLKDLVNKPEHHEDFKKEIEALSI